MNSESRRERWNKRYAASDLVWSAGPNDTFAREVADLPPGSALDVACGEGRNALWLAEQGWQATGIDFSSVGIDKASQIAERRGLPVHWLVDDVSTCALQPHSFDLVAVLFLHTSPEERQRWIHNVLGALKPGGTFLYIGHDPSNIEHGVGGPQDPDLLASVAELLALLPGYEVIKAEVIERPVGSDPGHGGGEGVALDTLVRAVKPLE